MTFAERIGGVLVAPRRTFARLVAGEARASDVVWLLVLRLLAGELDRFARALAVGREFGVGAAAHEVLAVTATVLPDVCAILVAGMVMAMFVPRAVRAFDVAAYAWIPYLATVTAGALWLTARGVPPSRHVTDVVDAVGAAWGIATWIVALVAARRTT
jgi:hypothetical protein